MRPAASSAAARARPSAVVWLSSMDTSCIAGSTLIAGCWLRFALHGCGAVRRRSGGFRAFRFLAADGGEFLFRLALHLLTHLVRDDRTERGEVAVVVVLAVERTAGV